MNRFPLAVGTFCGIGQLAIPGPTWLDVTGYVAGCVCAWFLFEDDLDAR